jgi:hypothetical protein
MKKTALFLFILTFLFIFGCKEKDEKTSETEKVTSFDAMIRELQGADKREIGISVVNGIYIKSENLIEFYNLNEISSLSFSRKLNLISKMDNSRENTHIVLNNSYILWGNYTNMTSFSNAPSILGIIGLKTSVYDAINNKNINADGEEIQNELTMDLNGAVSIVDFEEFDNVWENIGVSLNSKEYKFWCEAGLSTLNKGNWGGNEPSKVLHGHSWNSIMRMTKIDETPFSLRSIKLIRPYNTDQVQSIKITAYFYEEGSIEMILNLPVETSVNGLLYTFPIEWQSKAMKEYVFEFKEGVNGNGSTRFGAIDDITVNDSIKNTGNIEVALSEIAITRTPKKLIYSLGEQTINLEGLVVTGKYSNGVKKIESITVADISGFNTMTTGKKIITVIKNGKSAEFTISVTESPIGGIIIDHKSIDLSKVPATWISAAKNSLKIAYSHTSHGSQIITGMLAMNGESGLNYTYAEGHYNESVFMNDNPFVGAWDLGNPNRTYWATATRNLINRPGGFNKNVIMWSWCGQAETSNPLYIDTYLSLMNELELEFPNIKFVYMTGHLSGTGINGYLNKRNEEIREFCKNNNKILFDFADIESYDPDGLVNYMELMGTDNCDYDSNNDGIVDKNWAADWIAKNPTHELTRLSQISLDAAHSQKLNAVLKGRAFWWMMARIAGWNGEVTE